MISTSNTAKYAKLIAACILVSVFVVSFAQDAYAANDYQVYNYEMLYHFDVPL
jgi:hypothetical protein